MIKQLIFLLSSISLGYCCEIKLYDRYIKQSKKSNINIPFVSSSCDDATNSLISAKVLELSGGIPTQYLEKLVGLDISILPEKIEVMDVEALIEKKLEKESGKVQKILDSHSSLATSALGLEASEQIELDCVNCSQTNNQQFHFFIKNDSVIMKKFIVHATLGHKASVLKSKVALKPDNTSLKLQDFDVIDTFVANPEDFVRAEQDLSHYKINTVLKPGVVLQKKHLSKVYLIQTGREVEVILNHDGFNLNTRGFALQNGSVDEFIKVRNLDSKRVLQAKVIGENKVRIDL